MKFLSTAFIVSTFLLTMSVQSLPAQDTGSGLDFLNIGPSSSILSLGEGTSAVPTGSSSFYMNPALLSYELESGLDVNYTLWISNVQSQFVAVHGKKNRFTFGAGVYSTRSDDFEARNQPGPSAGSFSISYLALSGAASYQAGPLSVGITAHALREEIFELRANGYALNFGAAIKLLQNRVNIGVSLNNVGEMEELDLESTPLPTVLKAGISAQLIEFITPGQNDLPVLFTLFTDWTSSINDYSSGDFTTDEANDDYMTIGGIADIAELFELRGAYKFGPTERPFSMGIGISIYPLDFNYAFVPFSTGYGSAHSFGIQYIF